MKIVMVAGGTGGHIYPAVSLAKEYIKRNDEVVFYGANDRLEKTLIPSLGFDFVGFDIKSTAGNIFNKVKSVISMFKAYHKAKKSLKGTDLVIGFGNYISVPIVKAAKKLGIKVVLHEQNSFAGKANLILDKDADLIIGSYKENLKSFKNKNTFILGNPQSTEAYKIKKNPEVLKELGLRNDLKTVVIFMGSLGSMTVDKVVHEYLDNFNHKDYQVVYATGTQNYHNYKDFNKENVKVFERINGIEVMVNSDLVVSRAGATTLCEITSLGIASILIPSPFVTDNHQYHNAMALVDEDAATLLEEGNLTSDLLEKYIDDLIKDDSRRNSLGKNAKSLSNKDVIKDMMEKVDNLWKQ